MKSKNIIVLKPEGGFKINDKPREFVNEIISVLSGVHFKANKNNIRVGGENIGDVLKPRMDNEKTLFIFQDGELVEFNPLHPDFEYQYNNGKKEELDVQFSYIETIYNKVLELRGVESTVERTSNEIISNIFGEELTETEAKELITNLKKLKETSERSIVEEFISKQKDIEPEIEKVVSENFDKLMGEEPIEEVENKVEVMEIEHVDNVESLLEEIKPVERKSRAKKSTTTTKKTTKPKTTTSKTKKEEK